MKNLASKIIVTAAVVLMFTAARAEEGPICSNHTLHGDYAFRVWGEVFTPGDIVNRDGVATTHFDGNCNLTQVDWLVANGVPVQGPQNQYRFHDMETGTDTVNPDCMGQAQISFPIPPHGARRGHQFDVRDRRRRTHLTHNCEQPFTSQNHNAGTCQHSQRRGQSERRLIWGPTYVAHIYCGRTRYDRFFVSSGMGACMRSYGRAQGRSRLQGHRHRWLVA